MRPIYFNELTLDSCPAQNVLLLRDATQLFKVFSARQEGLIRPRYLLLTKPLEF